MVVWVVLLDAELDSEKLVFPLLIVLVFVKNEDMGEVVVIVYAGVLVMVVMCEGNVSPRHAAMLAIAEV